MWAHKPAAQQTSPARSEHPINSHAQHYIGEYAQHNLPAQQLNQRNKLPPRSRHNPVLGAVQHTWTTQSAQYNAAQHY